MKIRKIILGAAATALAISAFAVPVAAGGGTDATVWVAHGIPGAKVDVCVGKAEVKSNFKYGRTFSASLPAGDYRVRLFLADKRQCKGTKVLDQQVTLTEGLNATAVAWLVKGKPALGIFINELSIDGTNASLTVRHTAKAPTVDVYLASRVLLTASDATVPNFPRGGEAGPVPVKPGTYAWWVTLPEASEPVIGPAVGVLQEGIAYQVHAVGTKASNYRFIVIGQPGVAGP
jgi:hypothetical protein